MENKINILNKGNIQKRNYGIDALRLVAMFFVCAIHVLESGGVLTNSVGTKSDVSWLLQTIVICAVNCYGIVSGFVAYSDEEKPYRFSKYISLWLLVFFYSFGINLIVFLVKGSSAVSVSTLIMSALPVTSSLYWYFSAYTGLFFVIPLLNKFVRSLTKKMLTSAIILIFIIFSCWGFLFNVFYMSSGYSFVWLAILYLFGAWLKKCEITQKIKSKYAIVTIIICIVFTWLFKIFSPAFNGLFISYLSPTIVLMAIGYVIVFARITVGNIMQKIIKFLAPAAFGVYILHLQKIVSTKFIVDKFIWITKLDLWLLPIAVFGSAAVIFITCLIVERVRLSLFSVLRINKIAEKNCYKVELFIRKFVNKICDRIND